MVSTAAVDSINVSEKRFPFEPIWFGKIVNPKKAFESEKQFMLEMFLRFLMVGFP